MVRRESIREVLYLLDSIKHTKSDLVDRPQCHSLCGLWLHSLSGLACPSSAHHKEGNLLEHYWGRLYHSHMILQTLRDRDLVHRPTTSSIQHAQQSGEEKNTQNQKPFAVAVIGPCFFFCISNDISSILPLSTLYWRDKLGPVPQF